MLSRQRAAHTNPTHGALSNIRTPRLAGTPSATVGDWLSFMHCRREQRVCAPRREPVVVGTIYPTRTVSGWSFAADNGRRRGRAMRARRDGQAQNEDSFPARIGLAPGYPFGALSNSPEAARMRACVRKVSTILAARCGALNKEQEGVSESRHTARQMKPPLLSRFRDTVACVDGQHIRVQTLPFLKRRAALGCGSNSLFPIRPPDPDPDPTSPQRALSTRPSHSKCLPPNHSTSATMSTSTCSRRTSRRISKRWRRPRL